MGRIAWAGLVGLVFAQFAPSARAEEAQEIHPALFVARDADSTMYVFGTIHVRPRGAPWGGADAMAALADADEVWTELDISPEADALTEALVVELGAAPAGKPLSSWLRPEEARRLNAAATRLGLHAESLERARPWLAALTLTIVPVMQAGYDPASGVDRAVDAAADDAEKTRRNFETVEQQIRFLADLDAGAQRELLLDAIDEIEDGPRLLAELSRAWESGDLARIEALIVRDMASEYPALYDILFRARNAAWAAILADEMDGAGVDFVAVGAGHLVGEDGLVALLRARGVSVERAGE